jgi:hypothetical protein
MSRPNAPPENARRERETLRSPSARLNDRRRLAGLTKPARRPWALAHEGAAVLRKQGGFHSRDPPRARRTRRRRRQRHRLRQPAQSPQVHPETARPHHPSTAPGTFVGGPPGVRDASCQEHQAPGQGLEPRLASPATGTRVGVLAQLLAVAPEDGRGPPVRARPPSRSRSLEGNDALPAYPLYPPGRAA